MSENKQLGMKWFHFLIYFVLWLNAASMIICSLPYFNGSIWESPSAMYTQYPTLQSIDYIYGGALLLFGVFCIITRSRLAKFKKGAPILVYLFYIFGNLVLNLSYNVLVLLVMNRAGDLISMFLDPELIGSIVGTIVIVALNKVYFDKRAHLFVN